MLDHIRFKVALFIYTYLVFPLFPKAVRDQSLADWELIRILKETIEADGTS